MIVFSSGRLTDLNDRPSRHATLTQTSSIFDPETYGPQVASATVKAMAAAVYGRRISSPFLYSHPS